MIHPTGYIENLILLPEQWVWWEPSLVIQDVPHLKTVKVPNNVLLPSSYIQRCAALTTIDADSCVNITDLVVSGNPLLTSVKLSAMRAVFRLLIWDSAALAFSFPNLVNVHDSLLLDRNTSLTTISLPSLWRVSVDFYTKTPTLSAKNCTQLATVSMPSYRPSQNNETTLGSVIDFSGCALSAASVNGILACCAAEPNFTFGTVNLSGGTSSAPTGQGILDKATVTGRGVTVLTN